MMLIVQFRLTSHLLGELRPDHGGIRRFKKDRIGRTAVNQKFWQEQLALAARNLQLGVDVKRTVIPPASILPASIHLYRRVYSQVRVELFESFRKGTVLTFDLMMREDLPNCPSLDQLRSMFGFTGEYLGLSQFGSKFGFGRFEVETLKAADVGTLINVINRKRDDGSAEQKMITSQEHEPSTPLPKESCADASACSQQSASTG